MSEMEEAGYILLMPGGDWNADTTYHILHLVNHNGASWLCKVEECTGQEPSDSNTEFWQRFGTAVDLSNYVTAERMGSGDRLTTSILEKALTLGVGVYNFSLDRGNYTGEDLPNKQYAYGMASVYRSTAAKGTTVILWCGQYDLPIAVNMHDGDKWFGWDTLFTTAGGRVVANSTTPLELQATNSTDTLVIPLYNSNGEAIGTLGFRQGKPIFRVGSSAWYEALHTGNKPTGTYTGNGDATPRQINVDGIGSVLAVWGGGAMSIVTPSGVMGGTNGGNTGNYGAGSFANGILQMQTDSAILNKSGIVYTYWLL